MEFPELAVLPMPLVVRTQQAVHSRPERVDQRVAERQLVKLSRAGTQLQAKPQLEGLLPAEARQRVVA